MIFFFLILEEGNDYMDCHYSSSGWYPIFPSPTFSPFQAPAAHNFLDLAPDKKDPSKVPRIWEIKVGDQDSKATNFGVSLLALVVAEYVVNIQQIHLRELYTDEINFLQTLAAMEWILAKNLEAEMFVLTLMKALRFQSISVPGPYA